MLLTFTAIPFSPSLSYCVSVALLLSALVGRKRIASLPKITIAHDIKYLFWPADGVQFFALPVALGEGLLPLFVANTLYAGALCWYWYITHLGYRALPFLSNTEVFLFPIAAVVMLHLTFLIGYPFGFGWNATRIMARFYFM